jgi:hypothetical protein
MNTVILGNHHNEFGKSLQWFPKMIAMIFKKHKHHFGERMGKTI